MPMFRRVLLATAAFLSAAVPAAAQNATTTADTGPSLLWVWGWILIAGIAIFIIGTSLGARRR